MNIKIFAYALLFVTIYSCADDEFPLEKDYPVVETLAVTDIDKTGATLNARIINGQDIIDHGFISVVTFNLSVDLSNIEKNISLGETSSSGPYSYRLESNVLEGFQYKIRAYAKTKDREFFGNEVIFIGDGAPSPEFLSFDKNEVLDGDELTVNGKNLYAPLHPYLLVKMNGITLEVLEHSDTQIKVKIPYSTFTGNTRLEMDFGRYIINTPLFKILGIEVLSISKSQGIVGDTFTIKGRNIDYNMDFKRFETQGATGSIISYSDTSLTFEVLGSSDPLRPVPVSVIITAGQKVTRVDSLFTVIAQWAPLQAPGVILNKSQNANTDRGCYFYTAQNNLLLFSHGGLQWQNLGKVPCSTANCSGAQLLAFEENIFFIGGQKGNQVNTEIWKCNTKLGTPCERQNNNPIPDPIYSSFAFGKLAYLITFNPQGISEIWSYELKSQLAAKIGTTPLTTFLKAITRNGSIYTLDHRFVYKFVPSSNSWTAVSEHGRHIASSFILENTFYILDSNSYIYVYNLETQTWNRTNAKYPGEIKENMFSTAQDNFVIIGSASELYKYSQFN